MALDPCPHCGKEFDHNNAGARTQHVEACKEEAQKYHQAGGSTGAQSNAVPHDPDPGPRTDPPSAAQSASESNREPQAPQTTDQRGRGRAPDTQDQIGREEALMAGTSIGQLASGLSAQSPEEKAKSQSQVMTAIGGAIAEMGQRMAQDKLQGIDRAKNADDSAVERVEEYVTCPECGSQITDLPPADTQFECPRCAVLLQSQPQ